MTRGNPFRQGAGHLFRHHRMYRFLAWGFCGKRLLTRNSSRGSTVRRVIPIAFVSVIWRKGACSREGLRRRPRKRNLSPTLSISRWPAGWSSITRRWTFPNLAWSTSCATWKQRYTAEQAFCWPRCKTWGDPFSPCLGRFGQGRDFCQGVMIERRIRIPLQKGARYGMIQKPTKKQKGEREN